MRGLIAYYRAQAQRVRQMERLIPEDGKEAAENYHALWFFVLWGIGMAPFFYLYRDAAPDNNWGLVPATWAVTAAAWGISYLVYLRRMAALIESLSPAELDASTTS